MFDSMNGIACTTPTCCDARDRRDLRASRDRESCAAPRGPRFRSHANICITITSSRVEAGIDVQQVDEAAEQQAGARDQHQRHRHFGDDQRGAQVPLRSIAGHGAMAGRLQAESRQAQRRHQTGGRASPRRPATPRNRSPSRRRAACRSTSPRAVPSWPGRASPRGPGQRGDRGRRGQHQRLDQQLADQPPAAGAKRGPHRQLLLARARRARAAGW